MHYSSIAIISVQSFKLTALFIFLIFFIYTMFKEGGTISYKVTILPCGPLKYKQLYIHIHKGNNAIS